MKLGAFKLISEHKRKISGFLLGIMICELLVPLKALALTSGPSQPEFQGFTPLATTSLVDPFSGDFSYNIPLLDIDGYPLNLVYRATSNIEEEGSWVGYGWNINVGTLNRMVRGLPDDMNGEEIKSFQNIRERVVKSNGVSFEPSISFNVGISDGIGLTAGVQANLGFTKDDDDYTGEAVGVSVGGGVYAGVQAGPFSVGASAGVTLSANSSTGGSITTYSGFNAGASLNDYVSIGFGKSVNRTFNTISGWGQPNVVGSLNISSITREIQKNFINSISNDIPQITIPYRYSSEGKAYRLDLGFELGLIEGLGIDMGIGITATTATSTTRYNDKNIHKGYGYMYYENASPSDVLDFTRDNDGGINKDMPFMPPAMKTYDVFSSTAHGASNVFRADRNDFGIVRDPRVQFQNTDLHNVQHQLTIKGHMGLTCWLGVSVKYDNTQTSTQGYVSSGGCGDDMVPYRSTVGRNPNLFFKVSGTPSVVDSQYISQVNKYGFYSQNKAHKIKGSSDKKRLVTAEPISVFTNGNIDSFPSQTVISKKLESYGKDSFPTNKAYKTPIDRVGQSKIGAIFNTNRDGQTYVYATPVNNNIKNETAFRVSGFNAPGYNEREGLMSSGTDTSYVSQFNGQVRDFLYKNTLTPAYATSYLLNAVLSPDYIDVQNDGITDDDMGGFVKFNYTRTSNDYRWRAPYGDKGQNVALLNQGVKVTKFDDMGSYVIGSKETWYAHSIESKNRVAEFYISDRADAKDSRSKIMRDDHHFKVQGYSNDKNDFARMQRLDSIKYYDKHDRYLNESNAVPLTTIYFDYDYGISSGMPNSDSSGKLRLKKVRVRHGNEPIQFAETYDFGYRSNTLYSNPAYSIGAKDGWGNFYPNNRQLPLCEFPYMDQQDGSTNRNGKDDIASAFHLNSISLPSSGKIDITYEADDYAYVQDKRAMALTQVAGVGITPMMIPTDAFGLYTAGGILPHQYIYVKKPANISGDYKNYLLNGSNMMYFSFNINIAGNAFSTYDQVKGYAEVEEIGPCTNTYYPNEYLYIKVKTVNLTGTHIKPSPMVNTAINMARAYASDQLYFQEREHSDGRNRNHAARLKKAANQVADAVFGKNSIAELMKDFQAAHKFIANKSYVKLAMTNAKIGGGSRVKTITFSDEWNEMIPTEADGLIGYNYYYTDETGAYSSGVASYEPTLGGEENPFKSGNSYKLSNNTSKYPPYDPVELLKEDPVGESFLPVGSVGYSRIVIESIHKNQARSARSKLVQEFYTAKDFPYVMKFGPRKVSLKLDADYPNPGLRDILLSFIGVSNSASWSSNSYDIKQDFIIETNDMHGKPKATFKYRLLPVANKEELISSTEYFYHSKGNGELVNDVDVIQYHSFVRPQIVCPPGIEAKFPEQNVIVARKTLGVDIDVCTDSREVTSEETRQMAKRGGGLKICLPPQVRPMFNWIENSHKHTDYFKSTTTTKIINKYGIIKSVRTYDEGAETIVENKYYDAITGAAVVQVVKDKYGDNIYTTNVPAYWTKTDLEPSYSGYPLYATGTDASNLVQGTLAFSSTAAEFLPGSNYLQANFATADDVFHPGDELFVKASLNSGSLDWYRLYVTNVSVRKTHGGESDPLSMSYGSQLQTGVQFKVYVSPYKINGSGISPGGQLSNIQTIFKYRSGRKNMLNASAGNYQTYNDPFVYTDKDTLQIQGAECLLPGFLRPVINATATRYASVNSVKDGTLTNSTYNPVTAGIINQPYVSAVKTLIGDRVNAASGTLPSNMIEQRRSGLLYNWYYWLPARYDSTSITNSTYVQLKPMLANWDDSVYNATAYRDDNAKWFSTSDVTKSIPSIGPVEEKNTVGIYNSIFVAPVTKKVLHTTANGKFGQTWVESFEDMQHVRRYNGVTDFIYSPFQNNMDTTGSLVPGYMVFEQNQSGGLGQFTLSQTESHTGLFSLKTTSACSVLVTPHKYSTPVAYSNVFDFNLDATTDQNFTYEVWVKRSAGNIDEPSVTINSNTTDLMAVSNSIDGWTLYRTNIKVSDNVTVTFNFPTGQYYDDLRVFPAASNVKAYVYHPFKAYLMAILDENNYATYYEYNTRNQLVRLKKETEKGIITMTENIKNIRVK